MEYVLGQVFESNRRVSLLSNDVVSLDVQANSCDKLYFTVLRQLFYINDFEFVGWL